MIYSRREIYLIFEKDFFFKFISIKEIIFSDLAYLTCRNQKLFFFSIIDYAYFHFYFHWFKRTAVSSNAIKGVSIVSRLSCLFPLSFFPLCLGVVNKNSRLILATCTRSLAKPFNFSLVARRIFAIRAAVFTASCRHYRAPLFTDGRASHVLPVLGQWYTTPL